MSGVADAAASPERPCDAPRGCCTRDEDCAAGEACSPRGTCELLGCLDAEDVSACEVALCPGGNCPDPSESSPPTCSDGRRNGQEADIDCGAVCPERCPADSECSNAADCTSFNCSGGRCADATCSDGVLNRDETDEDCGGSCEARCESGDTCESDADCGPNLFCPAATHVCTDISCQDGALNGDEIITDCGGGTCPGCPPGTACEDGSDCDSGVCGPEGECRAPNCSDGVENQDETGADCGGACEAGCGTGTPCAEAADCTSQVCAAVGCAPGLERCCQSPSCTDGVQNGNEPAIDCGSISSCGLCSVGARCSANAQCQSGVCQGTCQPPFCLDGRLSGTESDVDCGGGDAQCRRCPDGDACRVNGDCASGDCEAGTCISCDDGVENGSETDVDCGGGDAQCQRCPNGDSCSVDGDCASGNCNAGTCVNFSCDDNVRNGSETGVDCGGSDPECRRCPDGSQCLQGSDCDNLNCLGGTCISCGDGVTNGAETDVDCGGSDPSCVRCAPGRACSIDSDCAPAGSGGGACVSGRCCGGAQGDCTRCAERLSPTIDCNAPLQGTDQTGITNCRAFLQCLASNPNVCTTRNASGCSGDNPNDACPHNNFGGNAGTGLTRANQVLLNAGCQL